MSESQQNEQGGHGDAAKENTEQALPQMETAAEDTAQSLKIRLRYEIVYIAPLRRFDGVPLIRNHYSVTFHKGHTRQKHWEAIGEDLGASGANDWYDAVLTYEQLERIRRDPGVKEVVESGTAVWG